MELTPTFMEVLDGFRPVFTEPSFVTFRLLMVGWIVSHRHRFVTDLIVSSESVDHGHFSDYHRFFSHASWDQPSTPSCRTHSTYGHVPLQLNRAVVRAARTPAFAIP